MKKLFFLYLILASFLFFAPMAIGAPGISEVIGWKFNHQPGMDTRSGKITRFPGGIPSRALQTQWRGEYQQMLLDTAYIQKRKESMAKGGYGTPREQLRMLAEQGMTAFQTHRVIVNARYPKPIK